MHKWFRGFVYTASINAIACVGVNAQTVDADVETAASGEDIIVTARRGSELLQDVPASVTVFTEKSLQQ